jgi:death-on-curing protein
VSWVWIEQDIVLAIHEEQVAEHGGSSGVRDLGLLESALARPRNLAAYGEPDIAFLAASYAFGLARNHPFIDGNKRTALVVAETFLVRNGYALAADDESCLRTFLALAGGEMTEDALGEWLCSVTVALADD